MKRVLAAVAVSLFTAGITLAQPGGSAVAQTLTQMENQWAKASKASDGDGLAPLLAEDFVAVDSDGSMHGKADVVARTKKAKWTTNEISDLKVMVHGDSAIVTGTWAGKGTDGGGKAVDAKERWADTWVKTASGKWQCVASASAPLK